jgi:ABC-type Fe3+/spermidine/putrescine transport system ATPase subunit
MAFLELQNIEGGYRKDQPVLRDFNLSVERGGLVSILGPSGCGKTTTLRIIAGFLSPSAGRVLLDGRDVTSLPPNKRNIGLVFQSYALFPHLSVYDNTAFGLRMRRVPKDRIRERVMKALEMTDLLGLESRLPSQLSGGQRQRVALSRAIVIEPSLLLLDEPLSNLDAKLRLSMRAELSRIQKSLGITMIYVTHDQVEALSLSDQVVVMNSGRIDQIGPPEDIFLRPRTSFVARFLGFDNAFEGTVRNISEGRFEVDIGGRIILAHPHNAPRVGPGRQVYVFFRSEDGELRETLGPNSMEGEIVFGTFQGKSVHYLLRAQGAEVTVTVPGRRQFADGERVFLHLAPEELIIEPKEL